MQENAGAIGAYTKAGLEAVKEAFPTMVGDVRGQGLFLGVEFIHPKSTAEEIIPHAQLTKWVVDELKRGRVITSRDGPDGNVLKIKPPLTFSEQDADRLLDGIKGALESYNE